MAFAVAAGISTFFTIPLLFRAIQGGEGAPDLLDTAGNAAVNIGGRYGNLFLYVTYIYPARVTIEHKAF